MSLERPAILLADTDQKSRDAFHAFFRRRGWECTVVTSVDGFGKAVEEAGFDIVIADSAMPGLDPMLLLGQVFRKKPSQTLVVVGESATSDHGLKLLRSGVTDVITKPVDFAWLERCVEQAVCAKRHEDRERLTYRVVSNERTEMHFSCKQLGEVQAISLPIISRLIASSRLAENEALKLKLALQEAVLNAGEHGNLELESTWKEEILSDGSDKFSHVRRQRMADPEFSERTVSVTSTFDGEKIEIVVKDQGKGFIRVEKPAVAVGDNLSCFGRGLTLIRNAVDEVHYGDGGSRVTLVKRL